MTSDRIAALTRDDIIAAARRFRTIRSAKWTVLIEGRELPARQLVLEAAGVPPNDPTNSHQAVKILEDRGFEVRYQGNATAGIEKAKSRVELEKLIRRVRGSLSCDYSLVQDREREHRAEKR